MKTDNEKKQKLKDLLFAISTPEEAEKFETREFYESLASGIKSIHESVEALKSAQEEDRATLLLFAESLQKHKAQLPLLSKNISEAFGGVSKEIVRKLEELKPKSGKVVDFSGFFKDMGTSLAEISKSSKSTSEIIRNLKWNTSVSVRNNNGSIINPATDGLGIGSYDALSVAYPDAVTEVYTFTTTGQGTVAIVTIVYTDATKENLDTVTRT